MKQYDGERSLINKTVDPYTKLVEDPNVNVNPQLWHLVNWATLQDRLQDRASKVSDLTFIYRVKACFDQNISNLSSAPNVADGVSLSNGDVVLLRGQTDKVQNGVYQWGTGGVLSRLAPFDATTTNAFANLNLSFNGVLIHILEGRRYKDEFSYLYSSVSKPIIGTHEIDFVRMPSMKLSQEPTNFLKLDTDGRIWAEIDNSSPNAFGGFVVSGGKLKILEDALPGFAGSLTIEQALAFLGVASKMNFNDDFTLNWDGVNARINVSINAPKLTPVGVVEDEAISGGTPSPPAGYLLCNGATYAVTAQPALAAKLGGAFITNPEINRPPNQPPMLTSNTSSPPIVVSASTVTAGFGRETWRPFALNPAYGWWSAYWTNTTTPPTAGGEWLKVDFGTAFVFDGVFCYHGDGTIMSAMTNYKLQGSNDDNTWVDILTNFTNVAWVNTGTSIAYRYWRVLCTSITNATNQVVYIRTLGFRQPLYSPIRFFQVPILANLATNIRRIIKA